MIAFPFLPLVLLSLLQFTNSIKISAWCKSGCGDVLEQVYNQVTQSDIFDSITNGDSYSVEAYVQNPENDVTFN